MAFGALEFGKKLIPAEGVAVQVPVCSGVGIFPAKRTLPAQNVSSAPAVANPGAAVVTFTDMVSYFAGHVFPPEMLNRML